MVQVATPAPTKSLFLGLDRATKCELKRGSAVGLVAQGFVGALPAAPTWVPRNRTTIHSIPSVQASSPGVARAIDRAMTINRQRESHGISNPPNSLLGRWYDCDMSSYWVIRSLEPRQQRTDSVYVSPHHATQASMCKSAHSGMWYGSQGQHTAASNHWATAVACRWQVTLRGDAQ